MWYVYILRCRDKTYYTGICTDLDRRIEEHNESQLGAKYTRGRRPVRLVYSKPYGSRSAATIEERRIKKLPRSEKEAMILP